MNKLYFIFANLGLLLAGYSIYWFFQVDSSLTVFLGWFAIMCTLIAIQACLLGKYSRVEGVFYFLLALAFLLFFVQSPKLSGHRLYTVSGDSNCPTLCHDDFGVIRTKLMSLSRGEFVVFERENKESYSVKRIHGVPGDTVRICNAYVYINGFRFSKKNDWVGHAFDSASKRCSSRNSQFTLQDNEYFVLGDGELSLDSRHFGVIFRHQIIGKVIYKISPETGLQSVSVDAFFSFPPLSDR